MCTGTCCLWRHRFIPSPKPYIRPALSLRSTLVTRTLALPTHPIQCVISSLRDPCRLILSLNMHPTPTRPQLCVHINTRSELVTTTHIALRVYVGFTFDQLGCDRTKTFLSRPAQRGFAKLFEWGAVTSQITVVLRVGTPIRPCCFDDDQTTDPISFIIGIDAGGKNCLDCL